MNEQYLQLLLSKYLRKEATLTEQSELFTAIRQHEDLFTSVAGKIEFDDQKTARLSNESRRHILDTILLAASKHVPSDIDGHSEIPAPAVKRVRFLHRGIFRYAAAIIILFGIASYFYNRDQSKPVPVTAVLVDEVLAPSSSRATLTLANGEQIFLDSAGKGLLAVESGTEIQKTQEGNIVYQGEGKSGTMQYNTLTVPRGSQIASIVLSDGTKVFLNAASSLKYPVAFLENERRIEITGEAYFEVARDRQKRFVVVGGGAHTEALGTRFNVCAYPDELSTKVTLIDGSVKVSTNDAHSIISPGDQAVLTAGTKLEVIKNVDISQVTAWQKGRFVFSQMDLHSILRQVSRWYNVEIEYAGDIPTQTFSGGVSRRSPLSELVKILRLNGVHCNIKDSILVIGK